MGYRAPAVKGKMLNEVSRETMESNNFTQCEKRLTEADLETIEKMLGIRLPDDMKRHYLHFNGGKPERSLWVYPGGEYDDIEVRDFIPMRYAKKFGDDPAFTAEGRAREGWSETKLPARLFPFAFDWGGNYFCVDLEHATVNYFVRDVWSDNISVEKNLEINTKPVTASFGGFVNALVLCEDQ
jgi:cell wall assembly regulator SMI1